MLITKTVPVDQIVLGSQMRESDVSLTNSDHVRLLASIQDVGLMDPIRIHIGPAGEYNLFDGGSQAARLEREIDIVCSDGEVY